MDGEKNYLYYNKRHFISGLSDLPWVRRIQNVGNYRVMYETVETKKQTAKPGEEIYLMCTRAR
jgi:hypothetical protein